MRKTMVAGALVAVSAVLHLFGFFDGLAEGFVSGFEGHPGLPSCASSHGQSDVMRAIDDSPFAKTSGLAAISIGNPKTVSANAQKVECTATVILNSARKGPVNYSFTNDSSLERGKYLVHASLDPESFTSEP